MLNKGMVGWGRCLGVERLFTASALAYLVFGASACFSADPREELPGTFEGNGAVGSAGGSGIGAPGMTGDTGDFGSLGTAGTTGSPGPSEPPGERGGFETGAPGGTGATGGSTGSIFDPCIDKESLSEPLFAYHMFDSAHVTHRELFSWTTDEQAARLRKDQVLFGQAERADYPLQVLQEIAGDATLPERAELARLLSGGPFNAGLTAWPEPWANRVGFADEDFGGNLLRIVLKPEAWFVLVKGGTLLVSDLQDRPVSLTDALANPTRLGAVFYQKDEFAGARRCDGSPSAGGSGYREVIVGNLSMVEEWSLGTEVIRDRLLEDITRLSSFFERSRGCPVTLSAQRWSQRVVCDWQLGAADPRSDIFAYDQALAIPSDRYWPVPDRIAALVEMLKADLFELDPLIVKPGSP